MTNIFKTFLNVFFLFQFATANFIFAAELSSPPYNFVNNTTILVRDPNLKNPENIETGSQINIDPKFLAEYLGTENPTQEQVQKFLLNPGEFSKKELGTEEYYDIGSKRTKNDYFIPVIIKTKSGQTKTGKMALIAYNRMGQIELRRTDGKDASTYQSPDITSRITSLREDNRRSTEAQYCEACAASSKSTAQSLSEMAKAIDSKAQAAADTPASSSAELWGKYKDFARDFNKKYGTVSKARAGYYKRLFVKSLVEKFGAKDAGKILAALTGFGEAPIRNSGKAQMAEIAAVLKVIDNRAKNNFRNKSKTLRDIGVSEKADSQLTNVLADWQFSVWNDKDNSLSRILNFNPDKSDKTTVAKMTLAFEAQNMINSGKIQFVGDMNNSKIQHYHANYVHPSWAKSSKKVKPIIKVDGEEIDISQQRGSRHIFYLGLT